MSLFNPDCRRCPLHKEAQSVCIPASGSDDAEVLFYGEAPGEAEDMQNRPFVGSAGTELNALLVDAGLSREPIRTSNVVRCRPPANREPSEAERLACMFYTAHEIASVNPKVIVALGVSALKALTGVGKIGDSRGKLLSLLPEYRSETPVLATYHPAAYLHNPGMRASYSRAIVEDMRLARKVASGSIIQTKIVTSLNKATTIERTLRHLAGCNILGCDLEWEVLLEHRGEPAGMWPWSVRGSKNPRPISIAVAGNHEDKLLALSVPFASDYAEDVRRLISKTPTIYHNGLADLIWLYHLNWDVQIEGDTYLLASLLSIDSSLSLEALALTLTEMPAWKQETATTIGAMPSTRNGWRILLRRNANDAIATRILHSRLLRLMREQDRRDALPLYKHVLLPATAILARTALNGTPTDEALLKRMRARLLERLTELTERVGEALQLPSDYEAIIGSGQRLAPYLERLGIELPRTKKTNRPSVTNDILLQNKKAHKIVPVLIRRRKLEKRESSYYKPWTWLLQTQRDGRLHTLYRLTAASTGRSSAESELGYTFQQFPRSKKIRRLVRAKDGWLILSVDQSQIELRIAAWLAGEKRMQQMFRRGEDLHLRLAVEVNRDRAIQTAGMLIVQYGLPPDGSSAEILCEVWETAPPGASPHSFLQSCRQDWENTSSGSRQRRPSERSFESFVERRALALQDAPKGFLRALRKYAQSYSPPSRWEQAQRSTLEHRDAVQIMSCYRAQVMAQFPEWQELRTRAKATGFGFLYGMGVQKFIQQARSDYDLTYTVEEAEAAREAFFSFYPGLKPWHDSCWSHVGRGWVETPLHRIRALRATEGEDEEALLRKAINTPVQATASDLSLFCMDYMWELLSSEYGKHLHSVVENVGFFHDAGLLHLLASERDVIERIVRQSWERPPLERLGLELPVPLVADITVRAYWS